VSALSLLPEMAQAGWHRLTTPVRIRVRRNWFYRQLLKGPLTDHIAFPPWDPLPRRLEDADALLRGRFRFHGGSIEVKQGMSVFDMSAPSRRWYEALHGFDWLPPLSSAGGEPARILATNLIAQWIARHGHYSEPAWAPQVMGRRLIHLFAHGRLAIANSDMLWRSKLFVSLRDQSHMLERIKDEAPDGLPRLEAAAALVLAGFCLESGPARLTPALEHLEHEALRQILPDGGYAGRSPEALLHAYRLLTMVLDTMAAAHQEPPHALRNIHDRIAPMLRFFRHGDGGLALFNGGQECEQQMIADLLARDTVRGASFSHARYSGYQRLAAGKSLILMDCGKVPEGVFSDNAHAGFLSIEFSSGPHRILVNCGAGGPAHPAWNQPLRATAAHSTLVLADTSSAQILSPGLAHDLLGPRLMGGPTDHSSQRIESPRGVMVEGSHDSWAAQFGLRHVRQVTLSPDGGTLTGADRLIAVSNGTRSPLPFSVRFHIHPDVRVSRLEGGGIMLKLPNGEGWRFRAPGETAIEESIYLGGANVRRGEQLVLNGIAVGDGPVEIAWTFERISS
jgi:uncharacterized heparinase superfamily protein